MRQEYEKVKSGYEKKIISGGVSMPTEYTAGNTRGGSGTEDKDMKIKDLEKQIQDTKSYFVKRIKALEDKNSDKTEKIRNQATAMASKSKKKDEHDVDQYFVEKCQNLENDNLNLKEKLDQAEKKNRVLAQNTMKAALAG
jgi:hypothetical protein